MAIPVDFFKQARAAFAELYQVKLTNGQPNVDSPVVKLVATMAYTDLVSACRREFHLEQRTTIYQDVVRPIPLKTTPLVSADEVWVDGVQLTAGTEYVVVDNVLYLYATSVEEADDEYLEGPHQVKVVDTAGLALAEDDFKFYGMLLSQMTVVYNRKDVLGFAQTTGEKGISKRPTDAGGVVDTVALEASGLVYYGDGSPA